MVDGKGYLQVDAHALAAIGGGDASMVDEMADSVPAGMKVAKDLLQGKWISFDPTLMQELAKDAPAGPADAAGSGAKPSAAPSPAAAPSLDPQALKGFSDALKDLFAKNVTFEDRGTKDGVNDIHVSAQARTLVDGLLQAAKPLTKDLPQTKPLPDSAPSSVPDRKIGADLFLTNGTLSYATIDLAQFSDKAGPGQRLPLKLALGKDVPAIQAPTGATEVTKQDIDGLVAGMIDPAAGLPGGITGMGSGPGADLPDLPDLGDAGPGSGSGVGKADPLTDAQLAELAKLGLDATQAKAMNRAGITFEELKQFAQHLKG
ncbi:hypothetical protein [Kitasatospora cinereorecta]|uniref:Uncharacterized protein n=1 Tax=Kitasatospora cinereorecta TaxID=285560 RepID=A0ABW0VEN2_9ACTN